MVKDNGAAVLEKKGAEKAEPVTLEVLLTVEPTKVELLQELAAGNVTAEVALEYLARLDAKGNKGATMKVSEKGCITFRGIPGISVKYGMSPRVETLEWLYAHEKEVRAFVSENRALIEKRSAASKAKKEAAKAAE